MKIKKFLFTLVLGVLLMGSLSVSAATPKSLLYGRQYATNEDSTAYLSTAGQQPAGGGSYHIGIVAVHPAYDGHALEPIIPFGTVIWLTSPNIVIQGQAYNHFSVMDTGDLDYAYHPSSDYWIDIYFGQWVRGDKNNSNYKAAINYGSKKVSYYWDEY